MNVANLNTGIEKHLKDLMSRPIKSANGYDIIDLTDCSIELRRLNIEIKLTKGKVKAGILNNRNVLLF